MLFNRLQTKRTRKSLEIFAENDSSLPPLQDPYLLPTETENFKEWHIKVLRRLNKHAEKEAFSDLMTLEVDIPRFIPILQELDLIDWATYDESLHFLKNENLKNILRKFQLKISGNKQDLIDRIHNNIHESDVRESEFYSDYYLLTSKGKELVDNSYSFFDAERIIFFKCALNQILDNNFSDAYRMICKRNAEKPYPPGIGVDWKVRYKKGIDPKLERLFSDFLHSSSDLVLAAASIYSFVSGNSYSKVFRLLLEVYPDANYAFDSLFSYCSLLSIKRTFEFDAAFLPEKYCYSTSNDDLTCPICKELNGKVFKCSERKVGVNCPPMHLGCRCTVKFNKISN